MSEKKIIEEETSMEEPLEFGSNKYKKNISTHIEKEKRKSRPIERKKKYGKVLYSFIGHDFIFSKMKCIKILILFLFNIDLTIV